MPCAPAVPAAQIMSQTQNEGQNLILEEVKNETLLKLGCRRHPPCTSNLGAYQCRTAGHPGCSTSLLPLCPSRCPPGSRHKACRSTAGAEQQQDECQGCRGRTTLQEGTNCSQHSAIPSKRQEPAQYLCKYLLLLVKTLNSYISFSISFTCLETQTAKTISRLTSSSVAMLL